MKRQEAAEKPGGCWRRDGRPLLSSYKRDLLKREASEEEEEEGAERK